MTAAVPSDKAYLLQYLRDHISAASGLAASHWVSSNTETMASVADARASFAAEFNQEPTPAPVWDQSIPGEADASTSEKPWPDTGLPIQPIHWGGEAPTWNNNTETFNENFPLPSQPTRNGRANFGKFNGTRGGHLKQDSRQSGASGAAAPKNNQTSRSTNTTNTGGIQLPGKEGEKQPPTPANAQSTRPRGGSFVYKMKKSNRHSRWPSKAEMRGQSKSDAERKQVGEEATVVGTSSPAGMPSASGFDVASAEADAGDGFTLKSRPIQRQPDLSLDIRDWNGGWAPAPAEWEGRPMFRPDADRARAVVMEWDDGSSSWPIKKVKHCPTDTTETIELEVPFQLIDLSLTNEETQAGGEICPRDWILDVIEDDGKGGEMSSFQNWWSNQPRYPLDHDPYFAKDSDDSIKPYWDRYTGWSHEQLTPLHVPEAKVDSADNDMMKVQRQIAELSMMTEDNKKLRKDFKLKMNKREKVRSLRERESYVPERNEFSPRANVYFRPAEPRDVAQLQEIWNYWMTETIFDPNCAGLTLEQVQDRLNDIQQSNLPFLVAVDKSNRALRGSRQRNNAFQERLLGFAAADEYSDPSNMYRYTVELDIFVRQTHLRKGIGRTLMDKILSVLDPQYASVGGYEWNCNQEDELKYCNGGRRVIEWIYIHVPHEAGYKDKLVWTANLLNRYDFNQKGYFDEIGRKLGAK